MPFDMNQRLPQSGMTVGELLQRAEKWWSEWRGGVRRNFNKRQDAPRVRAAMGRAPGLIIRADVVEDLPSGILSGKPWTDLTDEERFKVAKKYHEEHVLKPMREEALREAEKLIGGKN